MVWYGMVWYGMVGNVRTGYGCKKVIKKKKNNGGRRAREFAAGMRSHAFLLSVGKLPRRPSAHPACCLKTTKFRFCTLYV